MAQPSQSCVQAELRAHQATLDTSPDLYAQARRLAAQTPLAGHLLPLLFGVMIDLDDAASGIAILETGRGRLRGRRSAARRRSLRTIGRHRLGTPSSGTLKERPVLDDRRCQTTRRPGGDRDGALHGCSRAPRWHG